MWRVAAPRGEYLPGMTEERPHDACSFCGRTRDEVRALVAGPGVTICDDCVVRCNETLAGAHRSDAERLRWERERAELSRTESERKDLERVMRLARDRDARSVAAIAEHLARACGEALAVPRGVAQRALALARELDAIAGG